jgi:fructosamine-3-kinase
VGSPPPGLERLASALGPIGRQSPLGGSAWLVEAGSRTVVAKLGPGALDEAAGLRQLRQVPGAPPVPDVVMVQSDLLVTDAVDQVARTPAHEEALGRALAMLHRAPFDHWGGGSSWIGACRVNPSRSPDGAAFYGGRLHELSARCGLDRVVDRVVARLPDLLPPAGPALVHGDLWWGNVLFGADDRAWLIDPSVHGGHPEEDLAMLALFGPVPDRLQRAYEEMQPLDPGWEDRIALFQIYPLLVHTVLFDGGYRAQAEALARRFV